MNDTERLYAILRQNKFNLSDEEAVGEIQALLNEARLNELAWCVDHWLDTKAYSARIAALTQKQEN